MSQLTYDLAILPLLRTLNNLDKILEKAQAYVEANTDIEEATLCKARLFPNMAPLTRQVQIASDAAKGAAARLSGSEVPSWADDESTLEELRERVKKTLDYVSGFSADDYAEATERDIHMQLGPYSVDFTGTTYISGFVLPNFYFHVTTAYNILRHNGLALGKLDYLGAPGG